MTSVAGVRCVIVWMFRNVVLVGKCEGMSGKSLGLLVLVYYIFI